MASAAGGYEGATGLTLAEAYEAVDPVALHATLLSSLPAAPSMVLDIGSGSGRDAVWLAKMGHEVVAVEPSPTMRAEAQRRHSGAGVTWLDDSLPALASVYRLNAAFDVILLSAVWMHLPPGDRP